jgi:hypothetical protein
MWDRYAGSMCSLNATIRAGSSSDNDVARIEREAALSAAHFAEKPEQKSSQHDRCRQREHPRRQ